MGDRISNARIWWEAWFHPTVPVELRAQSGTLGSLGPDSRRQTRPLDSVQRVETQRVLSLASLHRLTSWAVSVSPSDVRVGRSARLRHDFSAVSASLPDVGLSARQSGIDALGARVVASETLVASARTHARERALRGAEGAEEEGSGHSPVVEKESERSRQGSKERD